MTPIELKEKLEKMSLSLKDKNIIEYFPTILNDLEFIIKTYNTEITGLTEEERINNIYDIEYFKIDYLAELLKKYMELTWNKEFSYEIVDGYLFNSTAGYNQKEDIVTISIFGMLLNSDNTSDSIKSIIHEYRHQLQYHFLHEKDFKGVLDYPPYFITIAKNMLPKEILTVVDEEGYVIDKPYYNDNYKRLYMEVDANKYGLDVSRTLLSDLYSRYPDKNKKLEDKVKSLEEELILESNITEEGLKEEKRIDDIYLDELYTSKPITSSILVDGKELDSLLFIDKCLKDNPIIKEKYEVIGILMHEYGYKNYWDLILDKYKNIDEFKSKELIDEIYRNIFKTDPILIITQLILQKDLKGLRDFIKQHPTFPTEYEEEIGYIINTNTLDYDTLSLLSKDCGIIKKKGKKYEE
jgi:hypothetical protein